MEPKPASAKSNITHPSITPDHLRRKALIYLRQSTPEQVRDNTGSTEFQRNQQDLARAYGWPDHLIEIIDEDLGKSGSSTAGRSGFKGMLEQIAAHQVGAVFAANISRLSRQLIDFESFRILASYNQTLLITDGRIIDPMDASDVVLTQISATFAQYENRKRAEVMSRSRMAKARQGAVVSALPVGWVKGPDGKYDSDPRVNDAINHVIEVFRKVRILRRTVVVLNQEGFKVPANHAGRITWNEPSLLNVKSFLTNPAYAGVYTYGRTKCMPEQGIRSNGDAIRVRNPEHSWIKIFNAFPAYLSAEEQDRFRATLKSNDFIKRERPGRGAALCQGLLYCALCKCRFLVSYNDQSHRYWCGWKTIKHGQKPCSNCDGKELDRAVERQIFEILRTPPIELLREALAESRRQSDARDAWIKTEKQRLEHEEKKGLELLDRSRGDHPRLYIYAQEKMENLLKAKEDLELKIAAEVAKSKVVPTDQELEALCDLVSDIPKVWHHPSVTHHERKEILRSLIEKIAVTVTNQCIEADIYWKSGHQTPIKIWRGSGRYNLIRELHGKKLNISEIKDRLDRGETATGQQWNLHKLTLYQILKRLRLKPNRRASWFEPLQKEATHLREQGRTMQWIADHFNSRGLKSSWGKPWTKKLISSLTEEIPTKRYGFDEAHRQAISDGRGRRLTYSQMAIEFNEKAIPRERNRPWTATAVRDRWHDLKSKGLVT